VCVCVPLNNYILWFFLSTLSRLDFISAPIENCSFFKNVVTSAPFTSVVVSLSFKTQKYTNNMPGAQWDISTQIFLAFLTLSPPSLHSTNDILKGVSFGPETFNWNNDKIRYFFWSSYVKSEITQSLFCSPLQIESLKITPAYFTCHNALKVPIYLFQCGIHNSFSFFAVVASKLVNNPATQCNKEKRCWWWYNTHLGSFLNYQQTLVAVGACLGVKKTTSW